MDLKTGKNWLGAGTHGWNFKFATLGKHYPQMNTTELHWREVHIGANNDLAVKQGALFEPMLTKSMVCCHTRSQCVKKELRASISVGQYLKNPTQFGRFLRKYIVVHVLCEKPAKLKKALPIQLCRKLALSRQISGTMITQCMLRHLAVMNYFLLAQ